MQHDRHVFHTGVDHDVHHYLAFAIERYDLCFSCHVSDLVKDKSGRGLTQFRNGDLNLHWLHVNREKGRNCRSCHQTHASSNGAIGARNLAP